MLKPIHPIYLENVEVGDELVYCLKPTPQYHKVIRIDEKGFYFEDGFFLQRQYRLSVLKVFK